MLSALPLSFVTIVDAGSITRAADELNLAKSAVSQNLKRLEEQLGVKLATRTTRRLSLTPAGERYYKRCREILALSQQAATEMEAFGATPSGTVTVTAPHALVAPAIVPAMAHVTRRFPELEPVVIADDRRLDLVAEGIDVAVSVGQLADSSLRARRVGDLHDVLCAAPGLMAHAPTTDDPAFADWIQSIPYIAHMREPATVEHSLDLRHGAGPTRLRFRSVFRTNTIEAIAAFARDGLGMALLPDIGVAEDLNSGRLVSVCAPALPEPTPIYAVHAYGALPPKSVQATINAVQAAVADAFR